MKDQFIILSKDDLTEVLSSLIKEAVREEVAAILPDDFNSPLLTRDEVARILDISMPTLNQWEKDGSIPKPKRIGKRVYWLRNDFMDFLKG
ncbi:MAG: helix-turn-helix domain-containing protein [Flavobacteriales bacterium]|nr:helix-turn-helix domain-containing protein [Flavobacteriales bacterium]